MARQQSIFTEARSRRTLAVILGISVAGIAAFWYFLATFGAEGNAYADPKDRELVKLGITVYAEHCARCHGADLEGEPNWRSRHPDGTLSAPPHDETGHTWHHPDSVLIAITRSGGQALAPKGFKSAMPGFSDVLSDREILASLAYIKSRWPEEILRRQEQLNRHAR